MSNQNEETTGTRKWRQATNLVRGGTNRSPHGETSEALFLNSGFVYDNAEAAEARFKGEEPGFIYSRYGNPTVSMFEERIGMLDGAETCFATASGMAAVFASIMCQVEAGDRVVAARALFGSCNHILTKILPKYGVEAVLVDGRDLDQWEAAITPNTRCVFFETPSNPTLEITDIAAVCELAHNAGARVIVDNVFATPLLQRPIEFGADITVYSGTKHIDGQGRCLGGAVLSSNEFRKELLEPFMRHTGPALSPFNAWVLLKGLETLSVRLDKHSANAGQVLEFLKQQHKVTQVLYPTDSDHPQCDLARTQMSQGGSVLAIELAGGKTAAFEFLNALELVDISNNLGDAKSLITHPATTTHRAMEPEDRIKVGISDGMVRLSVGLEDPLDLIEDLGRALDQITRAAA
jgi:O-succinylhomoserine sulfhydrylase